MTARLSRRFYDALGDEVAGELVEWFNAVDATYRSDLRDINELNFRRFDAEFEQRLAALDRSFVAHTRFIVFLQAVQLAAIIGLYAR